MKRIAALLLALILLCSGCATVETPYVPTGDALGEGEIQTPTKGGSELTLALAYYPGRSMNPFTCTDATNRMILSLISVCIIYPSVGSHVVGAFING